MGAMARAGLHPELRAAIRTTMVLAIGWGFACSFQKPSLPTELPRQIWLMFALSILALASAWTFAPHGIRSKETCSSSVTDKMNVLFALLFAVLVITSDSTPASSFGALLLIGGALLLAMNRR